MSRKTEYYPINTFSRFPSPAQICSYVVITLQTVIFYAIIRPNIQSQATSITLTTLFTISLLILIITTSICSYIDPSDSTMIKYRNGHRESLKNLQLFCQYCQAYVTQNAKHCRQCDRCVQNFDHHCMWINNCVGSKNYQSFIFMISSTCINLAIYLVSVLCLSLENMWQQFLGVMVTGWVVMVVVLVLWFLLLNLNLLHFYLMCKGYTTYQFIVLRKQEERTRLAKEAKAQQMKRQEKLREIIQNSKKKISDINPSFQAGNPRTPTKPSTTLNESQTEQQTNDKINISNNQKNENGKISSIKPIAHRNSIYPNDDENVFNEISVKSDDESIKIESQSIKADVVIRRDRDAGADNEKIGSEEQDTDSIRISQFFTRNKSFNYILSNQQVMKPHKKLANMSAVIESNKPQISRSKSNSSAQGKNKKILTEEYFLATNKTNKK